MKSNETSYVGLFEREEINEIEIPRIQRDYAQGRRGTSVTKIRRAFLKVLHGAVIGTTPPVSLDFVYGEVDDGTFHPLDGQQRLTTLFLLHWYVAVRADRLEPAATWTRFSYAIRPSARSFCERLTACSPPEDSSRISAWLEDQPWYRYTWRHDPTVQSMLVVLNAIHDLFRGTEWQAAWERLIDPVSPAITFYLLPIEEMGLTSDIYIKMNSRGKPLTDFETFKARFEEMLARSCPDRVSEFAFGIDGPWADVFWAFRGRDNVIDDELLRYFAFVTDMCAWRSGTTVSDDLEKEAKLVFGTEAPEPGKRIDDLIRAFDAWVDVDVPKLFATLFTASSEREPLSSDGAPVRLFGRDNVNLFELCCQRYSSSPRSDFGLADTLLLYAVLQHLLHETADIHRRLRVLRNLLDASSNEIRRGRMPDLIAAVDRIILEGDLDDLSPFNAAQVVEERSKRAFIKEAPDQEARMFELEDLSMLRGNLSSFELDAETFEDRAAAFVASFSDRRNWPFLTGALLTAGSYWRTIDHRFTRFGSGEDLAAWRHIFAGVTRAKSQDTRAALAKLLDAMARHPECETGLREIRENFLQDRERRKYFDWRYYFVRYPVMRTGKSGFFCGWSPDDGYDACMLHKRQMNSYYRDPYLLAVLKESGVTEGVVEPWFSGYESEPRWMRLEQSGVGLRCVSNGFELQPPAKENYREPFEQVCKWNGVDGEMRLVIPQRVEDTRAIDTENRIQRAAKLLHDLTEVGL